MVIQTLETCLYIKHIMFTEHLKIELKAKSCKGQSFDVFIAFEDITTDHKNVLVIVMRIMKIDRIEILKNCHKM